jgi:putative N6-adenine-specific DNA methylase
VTLQAASHSLFATCPRGLETLLAAELEAVGGSDVKSVPGGASFRGSTAVCYRANLESRLATRILLAVAHIPYRSEQDIYDAAFAIDWPEWFEVSCSIRVDVNAIKCPLKSIDFVVLRIKDAVCDRFRETSDERPNVDTRDPDVRLAGFLDPTHFTLYIDTSGEPLYKRGWRAAVGEAPLKENLAAGILRLSGWTPGTPLLDPMCGSGTLLVEAALMARNIAPGSRRPFGFEKLKQHDVNLWRRVWEDAKARRLPPVPGLIHGSDLYGDELKNAQENLVAAGVDDMVQLKQANVLEISPPAPSAGAAAAEPAGCIVSNPPYGVRVGDKDSLEAFYPKLGDALKARFAGWTCYLFSADMALQKKIGLAASKRTPLFNGALECRLFEYKVVAGFNRKAKPAAT